MEKRKKIVFTQNCSQNRSIKSPLHILYSLKDFLTRYDKRIFNKFDCHTRHTEKASKCNERSIPYSHLTLSSNVWISKK